MAKGLRASTKKANRVKLRSRVFGPVEDARTQRLSAKLLELASKPRPAKDEDVRMEEDAAIADPKQQEKETRSNPESTRPDEGMDIDDNPTTARKRHTPRPHALKRRRGKASSSVAFPVYSKGRPVGLRKKSRK
ncbi:hypothetical protein MMC11_007681 [Xylographa trunciseda]|nr:hypothetical protein [Xylographa trunciseda]